MAKPNLNALLGQVQKMQEQLQKAQEELEQIEAVSYTHLTLPTKA